MCLFAISCVYNFLLYYSQLTEEHNEELREIREGYEIKLKEMEKVCPSIFFYGSIGLVVSFPRVFCDMLCLFLQDLAVARNDMEDMADKLVRK